jgi:hypothetical protein
VAGLAGGDVARALHRLCHYAAAFRGAT